MTLVKKKVKKRIDFGNERGKTWGRREVPPSNKGHQNAKGVKKTKGSRGPKSRRG